MFDVLQQDVQLGENWKVMPVFESSRRTTAAEYLFGCKIMNLPGQQADGDMSEPCRPAVSKFSNISLQWQLGATECSWMIIETCGLLSSAPVCWLNVVNNENLRSHCLQICHYNLLIKHSLACAVFTVNHDIFWARVTQDMVTFVFGFCHTTNNCSEYITDLRRHTRTEIVCVCVCVRVFLGRGMRYWGTQGGG